MQYHHTHNWYMHKPENIFENRTHKILWDSEKRKNFHTVYFTAPTNLRVTAKDVEKINEYLDLARELKRLRNMKGRDTNRFRAVWNNPQESRKRFNERENKEKNEIIQKTALPKSARLLRRVLET